MKKRIITVVAVVSGLALTLHAGPGGAGSSPKQSDQQPSSESANQAKEVASSDKLVRQNLETRMATENAPTDESGGVTPLRTSEMTVLKTKNLELRGVSVQYYKAPNDLRLFHLINPMAPDAYFPERPDRPTKRPWAFTDPMTSEPGGFKFLSISF